MPSSISISPLVLMILLSPALLAAEEDEESPLNSEIELGAIYTSGNTNDENIQFRGAVNYALDSWDLGLTIDGFRSSKENELAAQRVYYVSEANYNINEESFVLTRLAHDDDRFSGYEGQSDISLNYGRNLLTDREDMGLTVNIGGGYRRSSTIDEDFDEAMFRLAADFNWDLSDSAAFLQEFSTEAGEETSIFRARSSIETQIVENLLLRFSVNLKHQTQVPAGRERTDTETSVTFVMQF
ncbi:MAG: DUF481 domain-containing protein [Gammaproteobacteria bacterium]|nr:DUF481 domain-containing protein [Gammaproteobacteria bacterium]MYF01299.1 DUF481 domain-containing protein [Gammaproteobacteria bacterium]